VWPRDHWTERARRIRTGEAPRADVLFLHLRISRQTLLSRNITNTSVQLTLAINALPTCAIKLEQNFKALHGLAPTYLADLCRPVASVGGRQRLRSATRGDLVVSPTVTHFGARSFAVTGLKARL